jgi:hypothetical protein
MSDHQRVMIKFMYAKNVVYIINYNMIILCQGREDNPLHTDAFNVYTDQKSGGKKSNLE